MKKRIGKGILFLLIGMIPFVVFQVLTNTVFSGKYLFDWMYMHNYLYIWVVVGILAFFKPEQSVVISLCNAIALFLGEFLGAAIREANIAKIEVGMNAEQIAHLYENPGFAIWLGIFVGLLLVIAVIYKIFTLKRKKSEPELQPA